MTGPSLGVKGSAVVVMVVVVVRVDVLVCGSFRCAVFFLSVCGRMSLPVYLDAHVSFVFSCVRGWTGRYVTFCGFQVCSVFFSLCADVCHFLCIWMHMCLLRFLV